MKKTLFAIMACACILNSCSKDDEVLNEPIPTQECGNHFTNEPYGWLDEAGVRIWWEMTEKMELSGHLYSGSEDNPDASIGQELFYLCDDTSKVSVKWASNAKIVSVRENKMWIDNLKKWQVSSWISFAPTVLKNLYVEAIVEFPDTTVRRCNIYPEIVIHDYDCFDFGTHKSEIKIKKELSPTMSIAAKSIFGNTNILEFKNDKLVKVYSIYNYHTISGIVGQGAICKIPQELRYTIKDEVVTIENPQEWNYGDLKFNAFNFDLTEYGLGLQPCISAELK